MGTELTRFNIRNRGEKAPKDPLMAAQRAAEQRETGRLELAFDTAGKELESEINRGRLHKVNVIISGAGKIAKQLATNDHTEELKLRFEKTNGHEAEKTGPENKLDEIKETIDKIANLGTFVRATFVIGVYQLINLAAEKVAETLNVTVSALGTTTDVSTGVIIGVGVSANIYRKRSEIAGELKGTYRAAGTKAGSLAGAVKNGVIKGEKELEKVEKEIEKKAEEEIHILKRVVKAVLIALDPR